MNPFFGLKNYITFTAKTDQNTHIYTIIVYLKLN